MLVPLKVIINIFLLINKHLDIHSVKLEAAMGDHVMVLLDVIPETLKRPLRLAKVAGYANIPLPEDQQANLYKLFYNLSVSKVLT